MDSDNFSELDIKNLIIDFNLDESINDLKKYYATPTTWEILKQSRKETSHTKFLAWLFDNKDFNADPNAGPIKKLIVLLLKWANRQENAVFDEELAESIYSQNLSIISYNVVPEYPINVCSNTTSPAYGEGSIDIFITVIAKVNSTIRTIHIVIENKIDATETKKCFNAKGEFLKNPNKRDTATTIFQTEAYYQHITDIFKDDINLFVYLKPTDCSLDDILTAECEKKEYIQINYQELLDFIIQPISEQKDISTDNAYRLKDYIRALGKPAETDTDNKNISNKKITIMAIEQKEKELLKQFFANNEDLIRAAINALGDEDLSASMAKVAPKGRTRNKYSINGQGDFTMYDVVEEFVKYQLKKGYSITDINDEINRYIGSTRTNVSDNRSTMVDKEFKDNKPHFGEFLFNGLQIRYTKEWGDKNKYNFKRFRVGINNKYPNDFHIEMN